MLLFLLLAPAVAKGYSVLAVYHPIAKSHSMFLERTARDLEAAGHNLTFLHTPLTRDALSHPSDLIRGPLNLYPLIKTDAEDSLQKVLDQLLWAKHLSLPETYQTLLSLASIFSLQCRLIHEPSLTRLFAEQKFDMVLSDPTFSPCLLRLTTAVNAPSLETVGISFLVTQAFAHGSSFPFSYVSGNVLPFGRGSLNFVQRVLNTLDLSSNVFIE